MTNHYVCLQILLQRRFASSHHITQPTNQSNNFNMTHLLKSLLAISALCCTCIPHTHSHRLDILSSSRFQSSAVTPNPCFLFPTNTLLPDPGFETKRLGATGFWSCATVVTVTNAG